MPITRIYVTYGYRAHLSSFRELNMMHNIPVLNLGEFDTARDQFVEQLKTACSEIGFFSVSGHGIAPSITREIRTQLEVFFSLPQVEKEKLMITRDNYRGYIPLGFFTPNESGKPADQYEAYKLHTEIPSDHPICAACDLYGENKWPELTGFSSTITAYWAAMDQLSNQLLQAFALALSLPEDTLIPLFDLPLTNMTLLHYPPLEKGQAGAGLHPHKDSDAFTILYPDKVGGLKVRHRDGAWIDAITAEGDFLVNVGDMMEIWSGGRFISTPHQVINPAGKDRFSFPYFAVPRHDCLIRPLVEPLTGFDRPEIPVGKWQAEVWRTNWADELPKDPVYDLGTINN